MATAEEVVMVPETQDDHMIDADQNPLLALAAAAGDIRTQHQPQQQPDANKRPRQSQDTFEGAGPSGATSTSSSYYLESRSEAILTLEKAVKDQVQPAVSSVVKRHQQFSKLERDYTWMQQLLEQGKCPKFIRELVLDFQPSVTLQAFSSSEHYQNALSKLEKLKADYVSHVFSIVLELKQTEKQQAEAYKAAAMSEAQAMLQQPFSTIPATWITKPEVQRASREQQEDFEFTLRKALRNVDKETQQKAAKQSQQAAAADASEVEAGAVTVEQQVQQAAEKLLKSQQKDIKQLQQQVAKLQKQTGVKPAAKATATDKAAADKCKPAAPSGAAAGKPAALTAAAKASSSGGNHRSRSRGRSKERSHSRGRNNSSGGRGSNKHGRSPSVTFADVTKGRGKNKQRHGAATDRHSAA